MQEAIIVKIAGWSEGKLTDEQLLEALDLARPDMLAHRQGFQEVVEEMTEPQREHCGELNRHIFALIDMILASLDEVAEGLKTQDRGLVFGAGDIIARNSAELNRAFIEVRNMALTALGPTEIPNWNLLLARRDDYLENPGDPARKLWMEAIDSERILVLEALGDLRKEQNLPEVETLINCFRGHLTALNSLAEVLEADGPDGDYDEIFEELEKGFLELKDLVPLVGMKLRIQGDTDYPDLNYLIKMMEDVAQGNIADGPLLDALESVDEIFGKSREEFQKVAGQMDSARANDEIDAILETYEHFDDAMEAIYNFLEQRDRAWLVEGKGCLLEFAKLYAQHHKQLREVEEQQGKVLCPMCSTPNESTRTRCANCGGPLPQNVAAATTSTFETVEKTESADAGGAFVTANIEKLYIAINQVAAGETGHEEFLEAVGRFEQQVEANVGNLPAEPELSDPSKQDQVEKVYDAFESGVEKLRDAIDLLRSFPEKNDQEVLAQAVLLVDEGAKLVHAAGAAVTR